MIPILYRPTETDFTSNGLGRLRDCTRCEVLEERNSVYEVELDYPTNGAHFEEIKLGNIILAEHDDTGDLQPFDLYRCSRPVNGLVTFYGQHISYRQKYMLTTLNSVNSLSSAFASIKLAYPSNPFSYYTDKSNSGYLGVSDGIPRTVRDILGGTEGSILDTYGGEYLFDKFDVHLLNQRGRQKPVTIRYGVNMLEFTDDLDYSESYNAVVPYWSGEDDGQQVTIQGDPILSGSTYDGRVRCVPLDASDKFETRPTVATLNLFAQGQLLSDKPYLPKRNITLDYFKLSDSDEYSGFSNLQKCQLCDYIKVVFPLYNMEGSYKIVRVVWDVLRERYIEMELGNLSTSLSEALGLTNR